MDGLLHPERMPTVIMLSYDQDAFIPNEMSVKGFCKYVRADTADTLTDEVKRLREEKAELLAALQNLVLSLKGAIHPNAMHKTAQPLLNAHAVIASAKETQ